jgi:hypothetical protein
MKQSLIIDHPPFDVKANGTSIKLKDRRLALRNKYTIHGLASGITSTIVPKEWSFRVNSFATEYDKVYKY